MTANTRKPGRPRQADNAQDAKTALLLAASKLFAARGADAVSVREVAEAAGVSPAMINYYFRNKKGLMRAVLERGLDRVLAVVAEVAGQHDEPVTAAFIDHYIRALNADPSLPQLMVREVLSGNPSYQKVIAERFVRKAIEMMPPRIAEDITAGQLRRDLDPRLTMLSLVGMCVFPFIAAPLLRPVLGYEFNDAFADQLVAHTTQLFNEGAKGTAAKGTAAKGTAAKG
ncbi:MAG: TetR family transcriptional regulator, partial [Pseudomonadales bacterium]